MKTIDMDSVTDLFFQLKWKSDEATHTDCYQASHVNLWRDILPPALHDELMGRQQGENIVLDFTGGEIIPNFEERNLFELKRSQFNPHQQGSGLITPQIGRFYPKGFLKDMTGIFKANVSPFRCIGLNNGCISVDFNHPLAGKDLQLSTIVALR